MVIIALSVIQGRWWVIEASVLSIQFKYFWLFSYERIKEWFTPRQPLDTTYISGSIEKVLSLLRTLFSLLNAWVTELDLVVCGDASGWWWWCWQCLPQWYTFLLAWGWRCSVQGHTNGLVNGQFVRAAAWLTPYNHTCLLSPVGAVYQ